MALFRFTPPPATFDPKMYGAYGREAESSWRKARDAWNALQSMGFNESTVFYRPDNSQTMGQMAFPIQNWADFQASGFDPSLIKQKDSQDFFSISQNIGGWFKPGTGPESTIAQAFAGQVVGANVNGEGVPLYSDPVRGLVPFTGIVKNRDSYDLGPEGASILNKVRSEGKAPYNVAPGANDLGVVFDAQGNQTPTQQSAYLASPAGKLAQSEAAQQVAQAVVEKAKQDPNFANQTITDQTVSSYMQQAQSELGPYFNQLFNQARMDLERGLGYINEDVATRERQMLPEFQRQLGQIGENAAATGRTFSLSRRRDEQQLTDATNQAIEAGRQAAARQATELGTQAERQLGSSNLPSNLGNFAATPRAISGIPGMFGTFQNDTATRSLYKPVGGQVGTLQQDRLFAEESRARELGGTAEQRGLKNLFTAQNASNVSSGNLLS